MENNFNYIFNNNIALDSCEEISFLVKSYMISKILLVSNRLAQYKIFPVTKLEIKKIQEIVDKALPDLFEERVNKYFKPIVKKDGRNKAYIEICDKKYFEYIKELRKESIELEKLC